MSVFVAFFNCLEKLRLVRRRKYDDIISKLMDKFFCWRWRRYLGNLNFIICLRCHLKNLWVNFRSKNNFCLRGMLSYECSLYIVHFIVVCDELLCVEAEGPEANRDHCKSEHFLSHRSKSLHFFVFEGLPEQCKIALPTVSHSESVDWPPTEHGLIV